MNKKQIKTLIITILTCLISLTTLAQTSPFIEKIELSVKHTFPNAKAEIKQLKDHTIIDGNYYVGVEVYNLNLPEARRGKEILENPQSYLLICDRNLVVKQIFDLKGVRFFDSFELVDIDGDNNDDLVIIGAEVMHFKKIWVYLRNNDKFNLIFKDECIDGLGFFINENNEIYIVKYWKKYGLTPPSKGEEYNKEYYIWDGGTFVRK